MDAALMQSVISGVIGGLATGIAAFAAIRVEMKYLRRDVDNADDKATRAHSRIDKCCH